MPIRIREAHRSGRIERARGRGMRVLAALAIALAIPSLGACVASSDNMVARPGTVQTAEQSTASAFSALSGAESGYRIGPLDTLDVSVFKVPDLTRTIQVNDKGKINFPLIGDVTAGGRTSAEVERELTARLGAQFLKSPQVTVLVKDYNSQRFTVEGIVKKPGVYPIRGESTLLDAIATAGGLEETASSSDILILRQSGTQKISSRFDLDAVREGKGDNPTIIRGDVIVVGESAAKKGFQNVTRVAPMVSMFRPY